MDVWDLKIAKGLKAISELFKWKEYSEALFQKIHIITNVGELQNSHLIVIKTYVYSCNILLPHVQTPEPLMSSLNSQIIWLSPKSCSLFNWTMEFLLRKQDCSSCWVTLARKAAVLHSWMVPPVYKLCLHTYCLAADRRKSRTGFPCFVFPLVLL